jgi:hypothetical protein
MVEVVAVEVSNTMVSMVTVVPVAVEMVATMVPLLRSALTGWVVAVVAPARALVHEVDLELSLCVPRLLRYQPQVVQL